MSVVTPLPGGDRSGRPVPDPPSLLRRLTRFCAALSLLCSAASFPTSALFNLEAVQVAGNVLVPSDEIRDRAGVAPGMNAFRVNAGLIRGRLLGDPRIRTVSVTMVLPIGVRLTVVERTPAAALAVGDGYIRLSADGVALASADDSGSMPILSADRLNPADVSVGKLVDSADARLGSRIAASLPAAIRARVAGVHIDGAGEASLELREGLTVRLGTNAGIDERLEMVPAVLQAIAARGFVVESVDLRVPGNVVVRPMTAPGAPPAGRQEKAPARGIDPALYRPPFP